MLTGGNKREAARKAAGPDVIFTSIDKVQPPIALAGQQILALSSGNWKLMDITRVSLFRPGTRREWVWAYFGAIDGVSVRRLGHEGMVMKMGEKEVIAR